MPNILSEALIVHSKNIYFKIIYQTNSKYFTHLAQICFIIIQMKIRLVHFHLIIIKMW